MPHGFADPLDFLPLNDFLWPSVAWLKLSVAIPCWVKASKSADLNLFSVKQRLFSSGCDRVTEAELVSRANFVCVWLLLDVSGDTSQCEACKAPSPGVFSEQGTSRDMTTVTSH